MIDALGEGVKTMFLMIIVIVLTQTLFFLAYSYCMSGDPFLALDNFYSIMYHHW